MFTYDGTEIARSCMIISKGDLVRIGSVVDLQRNNTVTGIIIQCLYGFGWNVEEWLVLINGELKKVEGTMIWPLENGGGLWK